MKVPIGSIGKIGIANKVGCYRIPIAVWIGIEKVVLEGEFAFLLRIVGPFHNQTVINGIKDVVGNGNIHAGPVVLYKDAAIGVVNGVVHKVIARSVVSPYVYRINSIRNGICKINQVVEDPNILGFVVKVEQVFGSGCSGSDDIFDDIVVNQGMVGSVADIDGAIAPCGEFKTADKVALGYISDIVLFQIYGIFEGCRRIGFINFVAYQMVVVRMVLCLGSAAFTHINSLSISIINLVVDYHIVSCRVALYAVDQYTRTLSGNIASPVGQNVKF